MANPGDFAATLKQQADIVRIIGEYIKLRKLGRKTTGALSVSPGEDAIVFGSRHAAVFSLLRLRRIRRRLQLRAENREHHFSRSPPAGSAKARGFPCPKLRTPAPLRRKKPKLRARLFDTQERAATFFQEAEAPRWIASPGVSTWRGLDEETIASFRIGYAPDSGFLLRDRLAAEFSEEVLRESGLFSWKDRGCPVLVRPLFGRTGRGF